MSLLGELKRRNVFRVALLYVVSAWVVIQVAETVLPMFDVPDGVLRAIVVVLAIGLVPAIVFAWVFELTPDGLRRDSDAQVSGASRQRAATRLNWATLGVAALAIALLIADRMMPEATAPSETGASASATAPQAASANGTSIAVLAFDNMSPNPDNAFFAEGISEEILNVLAAVDGLKVASRTSAFSFAGSQTPIPQIAETLGVEHVLEGSVRRSGNRVRITAQLIDARNDQHLWSDAYDRDLVDIFAVQEEIAQAITGALAEELGVRTVSVEAPTDDLESYQAFLSGREKFYDRGDSVDEAIAELERAVRLDPDFADAWAVLAAALHVAPGYPTALDTEDSLRRSAAAVERALSLEPDHRLALAVGGNSMVQAGDWSDGIEQLRRAVARPGQGTTPDLWLGMTLYITGYVREAVSILEDAWDSDPLVGINNGQLGMVYMALGRVDRARSLLEFAARNGYPIGSPLLAGYYIDQGHLEAAQDAVAFGVEHTDPASRAEVETGYDIFFAALREGRMSEPLRALLDSSTLLLRAQAHLAFDELDQAFRAWHQFLDATEDEPATGRFHPWLRPVWQPWSANVREHPAFFEIATRLGLVALWEERGYPPGCARVDGAAGPRLDCAGFPAGTSG
jgi:TolB-like protein/Tfp pilus assembly protein PilF